MSTSAVTLFGHWICPFSVRVEFALAQRGIEYTVVDVPPRAVRPKGFVVPEEFIAHSPKLEVPMVKIDGEYIKNLAHSAEDQIFVKSMVALCQGLGIQTIAEFVEDEDGVAKLLEYGVDYGQGWHFAKPQPQLKELVATYQDKVMDDYRIKPLLAQGS